MATTYEWSRLGDEIMDSRDLIAVADEIRAALEEEDETDRADLIASLDVADEDEAREILEAIDALDGCCSDWQYGETLIREDYFQEYAQQLAEDIGAINSEAAWPLSHIDWEAAAEHLKMDYTAVDYRGTTYYARA